MKTAISVYHSVRINLRKNGSDFARESRNVRNMAAIVILTMEMYVSKLHL